MSFVTYAAEAIGLRRLWPPTFWLMGCSCLSCEPR